MKSPDSKKEKTTKDPKTPLDVSVKETSKTKKKEHYVDAKLYKEHIIEFYKTGEMCDELAEMTARIANRLSYATNFINYCVDSETEALTDRGWLNYKHITTDDKILSYDLTDTHLKWSSIEDIFVNENYNGQMHRLTTKGLDAFVTPNHKLVSAEEGLKPVEHIKCGEHITLMGNPQRHTNDTPFDDDFIEIMGWAVTEGSYVLGKNTHRVIIFQRDGIYANQIRDCLNRLNADFKEYFWNKEKTIIGFSIIKDIANRIIEQAPNRILSSKLINSIHHNQRMLLIETMIKGDGWYRKDQKTNTTPWSYTQKDKLHIDSFVALCTLSGLTTTTKLCKNKSKFSTNPYYVVNIYASPKLQCKADHINFHGGRPRPGGDNIDPSKKGKLGNPNIPVHEYEGTVWCPKTEYGTFVCRRNGQVYITGNTYREEMVGDAIIKMFNALNNRKFDIDSEYSPFSYFTKIAFNAFCNRIKKEKRCREALLGYQAEIYDILEEKGQLPQENHPDHTDRSDEESH